MLAKISAVQLPQLRKWASIARLAKAGQLRIAAWGDSLQFSLAAPTISIEKGSLFSRLAIEAEVCDQGTCFVIPDLFFEALGTFSGDHCAVSCDGTALSLTDGSACCFALNALALDDASGPKPLADDSESVDWQAKLPGSDLKRALDRGAACATSKLSEQAWKQCVHITARNAGLEFESASNYMLSRAFASAKLTGKGDALLFAPLAKAIARLLPDDDVTVKRQGNVVTLEGKNVFFQVGICAERYPDTDKIVAPTRDNASTAVLLEVAELKATVERIAAFCEGDTYRDHLLLSVSPTEVRTSFRCEGVGSFENTLQAEVTGEDLELCLGAWFVRNALGVMGSEKMNLYIAEPTRPVRLEPAVESPGETYIIAPRTLPTQQQTAGKTEQPAAP
jgi:DNA polymerase III sliding clamp (beta) subunit (PCNA family)